AADRNHRVDRLDAGLQRLVHRLAADDARRLHLDLAELRGFDRAAAVDRLAERVNHAAEHGLAHRDLGDAAGALDLVALADLLVRTHHRDADVVLLEVENEAANAVRELDELARHHLGQAVHAGDTIADREHGADLGDLDLLLELTNFVLENAADLVRPDLHGLSLQIAPRRRVNDVSAQARPINSLRSDASCVRTLPS